MKTSRKIETSLFLLLVLLAGSGCVYYNTFYYARRAYNKAYQEQKKQGQLKANPAQSRQYEEAIQRASKVLANHPRSSWVDDALLLIGKSYFYEGEYQKAERTFRELIAGFPKSKFVPEAQFFIGWSLVLSGSYDNAMTELQRTLGLTKSKDLLSQVEMQLAETYYIQEEYDSAIVHFQTLVERYGNDKEKGMAQFRTGESFMKMDNHREAAAAFEKVLKYSPPLEQYFNARFYQAGCLCESKELNQGIAILRGLARDERFYKNSGRVNLKLAEAHLLLDSVSTAIDLCEKVTSLFPQTPDAAQAYYQLGEIYQKRLGDLKKAKEQFDKAASEGRGSEYGRLAVARSSDIAKLETYQKAISSEETEKAAQSQFLLGEVYYHQLDQPDSAVREYRSVVENHPESPYAAKALAALAYIYLEEHQDTTQARAAYRALLDNYPHADCARDAIYFLGLAGTAADTGYPAKVFADGERLLANDHNVDSALTLFRSIPVRFPQSQYVPRAFFTVAWILENFKAPADSSVYYAYRLVADSFPNSPYAQQALVKLGSPPRRTAPPPPPVVKPDTTVIPKDTLALDTTLVTRAAIPMAPRPIHDPQFVYPPSQKDSGFQDRLRFKILINFLGNVADVELLNPSSIQEIDEAAKLAVHNLQFDPLKINPRQYNTWFIYELDVIPPAQAPFHP